MYCVALHNTLIYKLSTKLLLKTIVKEENEKPLHPGKYVKENIIPESVTVKKAAEMMGIGRPALSNFLNGRSNLSHEMAARLSKTFSADKTKLLNLQQSYTDFLRRESESQIAVRSYAPSFLNIRAAHIDAWAGKNEARSLLPALLRRLVNSTSSKITHSDFPAFDNSQRHGWDGYVDSEDTTPWVPGGVSGWEFGCSKNPGEKANGDFSNRTENIDEVERKKTIFIFVTPHTWSKKNDWVKSKKEKNEWKDVRAYDANDLEQWIEQSVPAQVFLADKIGIPLDGCQTLSDYWENWSSAANPPISRKIFDSAIASHNDMIERWHENPDARPLVITAESKEEALAYLACAFESKEKLHPLSERTVLVSDAAIAKRLAGISNNFIPIAYTDSAEKELINSYKNRHTIIIAEKNIKDMDPDIIVELPNYDSFRKALTDMGFDDAQIDVHSNKCGMSPTILRRQLATAPALKKPVWARDNSNIRMMIPLALAGTWKHDQDGDKEILMNLADSEYTEIEKNVAYLSSMDDAPVWIEGMYRGITSKLDCFYVISDQITEDDLKNFFLLAEYVLSEDDPALDLDKERRWAANLYNKVRDHSSVIRNSICESLIIFSVHGHGLFGNRLRVNIEAEVNMLIRRLLSNKNGRVWQSQQSDLPKYAEAAPGEFLDIIEKELQKESTAFESLFESVDGGMFARCERTGMLWALELLAWKDSRLSRVIRILAQLCRYQLDDNWSNKPISSLKDILLSWLPHTAATLQQRTDVLELLCRKYSKVGWKVCISELKPGNGFTSGTYRPRWRSDASGAGLVVNDKERFEFLIKCQNIVLSWPTHTIDTLCDLIDCIAGMKDEDREKVSDIIAEWYNSSPPDEEIIQLREHVRTRTMTTRMRNRDNDNGYANGKKIYELLEPQDIVFKHQWLFAKQWVEYSPEELEVEDLNYEEREKKLSERRIEALKEVFQLSGFDGLIKLSLFGEGGFNVGWFAGKKILNKHELVQFTAKCLSIKTDAYNNKKIDQCISGILHQFDNEHRLSFMKSITDLIKSDNSDLNKITRITLNAPFRKSTWDFILTLEDKATSNYWNNVYPQWGNHSPQDLNFILDQLLHVNRPRAAFQLAYLKPDLIDSAYLIKLLHEIATNTSEPKGQYQAPPYAIEKAFESLNKRNDVDRIQLIELEYQYIQVLTPTSKYGIPNLSKEIAQSPLLFMQMVALCFKRDDSGADPDEWQLPTDHAQRQSAASNAFRVLDHINIIPGSKEDGTIDAGQLRDWIADVRTLAKEHGRADITDQKIGYILSKSEIDTDGIWPKKEVRKVFDEFASEEISIGMGIGLRNSRGASFRPENGSPERALAEKYHEYANSVMNKYPFTGRMLMGIAESYEHDAKWYDTDGRVNKRLRK